jgi:hypothetical protein
LYGTEDEIVYEEEKCGLMETWDALSTKYMNNIDQNAQGSLSNKLLKDVKIEVDTFLTTVGLLDKNIIKSTQIKKREEKTYNFKDSMINSSIEILDKGILALSKASLKLKKLDEVLFKSRKSLKDLGVPIKTVDGQLRIYFTKNEYAVIDSEYNLIHPDSWKPTGFIVVLRYENNSYSTVISPQQHLNPILNIKEYFRECNLVSKRSKLNLSFEVLRNTQEIGAGLPSSFIESKLDFLNRTIFKIIEKNQLEEDFFITLNISLSNIFFKSLVNSLDSHELVPLSKKYLFDDLPEDFVIVSDKIYKFKRHKYSFDFFVNEERTVIQF